MARSAAPHLSLIIGHEALFRRNGALLALVRAAREQGAETSALAYMRRMSDDLRSVHVQWLFRESRRFAEAFWIGPAYFKPRKMRDPGELAERTRQEAAPRCRQPETERLARIQACARGDAARLAAASVGGSA